IPALVALAITLEGGIPAALVLVGEKTQVFRLPVAGHEALKVAPVPGRRLRVENLLNGFLSLSWSVEMRVHGPCPDYCQDQQAHTDQDVSQARPQTSLAAQMSLLILQIHLATLRRSAGHLPNASSKHR